jgi:NAD-dependent deacetylase
MQKIIVLTGAGISAESGIKTFRDADGLWEGHDVMEVATPEGWAANPALVLDFYNQRRRQLSEVLPNAGHEALVTLETKYDTHIITQNVDNLHEVAGSKQVIHLHGELKKVRSVKYPDLIYHWTDDLHQGDLCERGAQLRPHIVWFGEQVPLLDHAISLILDADICIIIGTSMQVYPAASLISYAPPHCKIYYVDPKPHINHELSQADKLIIIPQPATTGVPKVVDELMKHSN